MTQAVDLSRVGTHLALDVADLRLHRYDGTTEKMGALCEIGEPSTVTQIDVQSKIIYETNWNPGN